MPLHLLILSIVVCLLSACKPDVIKAEQTMFEQQVANHPDIIKETLRFEGHQLFYARAGDTDKPSLVIVHGTPGDWQQYARYLLNPALREHFQVISIDRPGWGQSILAGDEQTADFDQQSHIIAALGRQLKQNQQPVIYMGHSLGASLIPFMAVNHPEVTDGLLILAGTLVPDYAGPRWYNYLAAIPGMGYLIGQAMKKSNQEIFQLDDEMQKLQPAWPTIQTPTLVVQGSADSLVHPENIDVLPAYVNPDFIQIISLNGAGHLFPMTQRKAVVDWSLCLLRVAQQQATLDECQRITVDTD